MFLQIGAEDFGDEPVFARRALHGALPRLQLGDGAGVFLGGARVGALHPFEAGAVGRAFRQRGPAPLEHQGLVPHAQMILKCLHVGARGGAYLLHRERGGAVELDGTGETPDAFLIGTTDLTVARYASDAGHELPFAPPVAPHPDDILMVKEHVLTQPCEREPAGGGDLPDGLVGGFPCSTCAHRAGSCRRCRGAAALSRGARGSPGNVP